MLRYSLAALEVPRDLVRAWNVVARVLVEELDSRRDLPRNDRWKNS